MEEEEEEDADVIDEKMASWAGATIETLSFVENKLSEIKTWREETMVFTPEMVSDAEKKPREMKPFR